MISSPWASWAVAELLSADKNDEARPDDTLAAIKDIDTSVPAGSI
jgi:hypothetical protein